MRPSEALERHRDGVCAIVRRFAADNPRLFGSVARGEDVEGSDIDIPVDLPEQVSYHQSVRVEGALCEVLGCKVDVDAFGDDGTRFFQRMSADVRPI